MYQGKVVNGTLLRRLLKQIKNVKTKLLKLMHKVTDSILNKTRKITALCDKQKLNFTTYIDNHGSIEPWFFFLLDKDIILQKLNID